MLKFTKFTIILVRKPEIGRIIEKRGVDTLLRYARKKWYSMDQTNKMGSTKLQGVTGRKKVSFARRRTANPIYFLKSPEKQKWREDRGVPEQKTAIY